MAGSGSTPVGAAQAIIARLNDAVIFPTITLLMGVAVVVFAWGVFKYVQASRGGADYNAAKDLIMWSIIGFVIMVSARAILSIAAGAFGLTLTP
ncbi:hypothetical protein A3C89_01515 [Candidatus Kaiserbacteria bacterium RIFCSPHIGHO2_02_FULL_50_50]|uniref:Uncharacterized protein n=1 Tax=Candidatus Kaiserbacteria bacterium RIFCSPHIGHO2_02_FULL_50_50 TaxID=1798492 RepID=A0A1F6DCA7_9BACT|nr:MAG: hypothetical protein A3C89_01515 [Candidatus Kaiserbacteria bacterium RIFCSPHIGHO2_02_FULL_50_50]OGG89320.1 MAG: hypothetical protein A3G62_01590 [Candidatus Kaiserbacteria bacterium RIFCSPLOWO2_12_FULL_50_10]